MSQKEFVDYSQEMAHLNSSYRKSINEEAVRSNLRSLFENSDTGGGYYHENPRNRTHYSATKVTHQSCIPDSTHSAREHYLIRISTITTETKAASANLMSTF